MANPKPKFTPKERLQRELKAHKGRVEEVNEFRKMLRDIVPLCRRAINIADFIEARIDLGLIIDPGVMKCAEDILRYCYQIEDEAMGIKPGKEKPRVDNTEAIIAREEAARNAVKFVGTKVSLNMAGRMAKGFDRLLDELIRDAQRSG